MSSTSGAGRLQAGRELPVAADSSPAILLFCTPSCAKGFGFDCVVAAGVTLIFGLGVEAASEVCGFGVDVDDDAGWFEELSVLSSLGLRAILPSMAIRRARIYMHG